MIYASTQCLPDRGLEETLAAYSRADIEHVEPRRGDIRESVADIGKARDRLDYEPTVSLGEGLERYLS